jgi:hypothetical protein
MMFKSWKKIAAMAAAMVIAAVGHKVGLSDQAIAEIVAAASAFIIGQGIADAGKSAAIIKAQVDEGKKP